MSCAWQPFEIFETRFFSDLGPGGCWKSNLVPYYSSWMMLNVLTYLLWSSETQGDNADPLAFVNYFCSWILCWWVVNFHSPNDWRCLFEVVGVLHQITRQSPKNEKDAGRFQKRFHKAMLNRPFFRSWFCGRSTLHKTITYPLGPKRHLNESITLNLTGSRPTGIWSLVGADFQWGLLKYATFGVS